LASSPTDLPVHHYESFDGARIAWREMAPEGGGGRPVVLIHGFFSTALVNWVRYGHAAKLVADGFRVIMPDLRGHGDSARPHDAASYPRDALADDGFALIDRLGLTDYDLGGYSLGGRTTIRMLARGARPRRAIVSGMGLEGIVHTAGRGDHFRHILTHLGSFQRGSPEWMAEAFLKTTGSDPVALLHVLDTFEDTPHDALAGITMPILVVSGEEDHDNGSGAALAEALPAGRFASVPGNHMSAVIKPELGTAIAGFLADAL
jgi:pimeloyl-ACP methyl ester carboxylesterase